MQDPNPLPWGAQDRFQAHFIVKQDPGDKLLRFTARTNLETTGHFGSKKITGVTWDGGELAEQLNADLSLNKIITKQQLTMRQSMLIPQIMEYEFMENGKTVMTLVSQKNCLKFMIRLLDT